MLADFAQVAWSWAGPDPKPGSGRAGPGRRPSCTLACASEYAHARVRGGERLRPSRLARPPPPSTSLSSPALVSRPPAHAAPRARQAHAGRTAPDEEQRAEVRKAAAAALAALLGAVRERAARWPDFVFTAEYAACARDFGDVMRYVREHGHLPYMRPAALVRRHAPLSSSHHLPHLPRPPPPSPPILPPPLSERGRLLRQAGGCVRGPKGGGCARFRRRCSDPPPPPRRRGPVRAHVHPRREGRDGEMQGGRGGRCRRGGGGGD